MRNYGSMDQEAWDVNNWDVNKKKFLKNCSHLDYVDTVRDQAEARFSIFLIDEVNCFGKLTDIINAGMTNRRFYLSLFSIYMSLSS